MLNCESKLGNVIKQSSFAVDPFIYIFVHVYSLQLPLMLVFSFGKLTLLNYQQQLLLIVIVSSVCTSE